MRSDQLVGLGIFAFFVAFSLYRRLRPQPVRPTRVLVTTGVIVVVVVLTLSIPVRQGQLLTELELMPLFLLAGVGLGVLLVRTMTFWAEPSTGELWMKGGALFAGVFLGSLVLRVGVRLALGETASAGRSSALLAAVSTDLLFLVVGLWLTRAVILVRRHRAHQAGLGERL